MSGQMFPCQPCWGTHGLATCSMKDSNLRSSACRAAALPLRQSSEITPVVANRSGAKALGLANSPPLGAWSTEDSNLTARRFKPVLYLMS